MIQGELPMRIRFLVLSLLVLCLAVSGCQQTQEPAVKVGVVDMNRLLRDSEPGKEASRFLEGMQKEIQQQIDDVQARLGKDPENENLQRELQAIYMGGQQRINAEQQNVVSQLLDLTQRLVNNYRKANGLSVVLGTDVAVAYDPALDVTNALLDEMNKQKVNFVSVSNPQPEAPAAAEAPNVKRYDKECTTQLSGSIFEEAMLKSWNALCEYTLIEIAPMSGIPCNVCWWVYNQIVLPPNVR